MRGPVRNRTPWYLAGITLFFIALFVIAVLFPQDGFLYWGSRSVRRLWASVGDLAALLAIVSVGLWGIRKIALAVKGKKADSVKWLNGRFALWLRKTHIFLGWLAFALGFSHGIYFLDNMPDRIGNLYTGLAAIIAMLMLLGLGIMYQKKIIKIKIARRGHMALAIIFGALLLLHM